MSRRAEVILMVLIMFTTLLSASSSDHDDHSDDHGEEEHNDHQDGHNIWLAFTITTGCGLAALIGYCSIFCMKKEMKALIPASLSFSSGVIVYLSFMNLIPESIELLHHATGEASEALSHFYALLCIIGGMTITLAMDFVFQKLGVHVHGNHESTDMQLAIVEDVQMARIDSPAASTNSKAHQQIGDEVSTEFSADELKTATPTDLSHISFSVAFALIMHHFPEGIATFISLYYDLEFGALVALALALHDIPSGICISATAFCASGSKIKPFLLCLIAALVYPFGAFIGWAILETTTDKFIDVFIGVLFGMTGGVMLFVAFIELLPAAIITAKKYNVETMCFCLIFIGFLVMDISAIVLKTTGGHSH